MRSTREHRGERWATHLDGFGPDDTARGEHIAAAQKRLLGWARGSALPLTVLRTGPENWERNADAIVTTILEARTTRAIARPNLPIG